MSGFAQSLRDAGYRLTKPRLAVIQVLEGNAEGLSPEAIHTRGKGFYSRLGLVTVYRTLSILQELGMVRRVHNEERCQSFARADAGRHYIVCDGCRRVTEFPCAGLDTLVREVSQNTGYKITGHLLELRGLCPRCQSAAPESAAGGSD